MGLNSKDDIRNNSVFAKYVPKTEAQTQALELAKSIAGALVDGEGKITITGNDYRTHSPFDNSILYVLSGKPGVGKTHLIESILNDLKARAPSLYDISCLRRGPLPFVASGSAHDGDFDGKPLIFLDDVWADKSSVKDLNNDNIRSLMGVITWAYERRAMIVMTTNFPFVSEILPVIKQHDPVGRVVSRTQEMLDQRACEINIEGPDHRAQKTSQPQLTSPKFF